MRARKRQDYDVRVYRYGVRLPQFPTFGALPQPVRDEAIVLRDLWNSLVPLFEKRRQDYQAALSAIPSVAEHEERIADLLRQKEEAHTALKQAQQRLRTKKHPELELLTETLTRARHMLKEAYPALKAAKVAAKEQITETSHKIGAEFFAAIHAAERACPAYWCNKEFVVNSFQTATARALKEGADLHKKFGIPRELRFCHRFTASGIPAHKLFAKNSRVWVEPPEDSLRHPRSQGQFTVGGEPLPFEVQIHRSLPVGAIIKSVALVGRQQVHPGIRKMQGEYHPIPARWEWSLHVSIEIPPVAHPPKEAPVAAIDLGYRQRADGQMRIGFLVDSTGHEEELVLPLKIINGWQYAQTLQQQADASLEATKAALSKLSHQELPPEAQDTLRSLSLIRATGLRKLLRLVAAIETEHREILQRWAARDTCLFREAAGVRTRYLAHREHLYRNWASALTKQYRVLILEDLDLKKMGEQEKSAELEAADKYKFLAGLSFLRGYLVQAGQKNNCEIRQENPAYTTIVNADTGAETAPSGNLHLTWPDGRMEDQDRNAARGLLASFANPPGFHAQVRVAKNRDPGALQRPENAAEC